MDRIKKKHLLRRLENTITALIAMLFLTGICYALGYFDVWPFRFLLPDRITGLCGIQLDQPWDGKTYNSFRTFSKPTVLTMKDSGVVRHIAITSLSEDYDQIIKMIEDRYGIEPIEITGIHEGISKEHFFKDSRSGNYIEVKKKIVPRDISPYEEYLEAMSGRVNNIYEVVIVAYSIKCNRQLSKEHEAKRREELKNL